MNLPEQPPKTASEMLMDSIEAFDAGESSAPLPFRLRNAVERVRAHICGLFGVKAATVSDAHVAKFLGRTSPEYLFRHLPGIGYQTEEELLKWAAQESQPKGGE